MGEYLSTADWDRIREFADTPTYDRSPEQLVPANAEREEDIEPADEAGDRASRARRED